MSSRVFRRLQGKDSFIEENDCDNNDTSENDVTCGGGARRKTLPVNLFDLLDRHSNSESDVKEEGSDELETVENIVPEDSKKKKKRKKKSGRAIASNHRNIEDDLEFDVDNCNANVGTSGNQNSVYVSDKYENATEHYSSAISIKLKNLNPNNELKRIFGTRIVENDNGKRRTSRGRTPIRNFCLVKPKERWPHLGKTGISMKVDKGNRKQTFTYVHSADYQRTQFRFLSAVNSLNPDNIATIMNTHPYHVDTLIQLSDLYKLNDDLQMAAELIEQALYCLEAAFHPLFNIARGNCQLDYRHEENRAFFVCLFKHLNFVGQRACYQTALELCKLLLSLDFESDPMAVVLSMDFYSLRSRNYTWLINAANEWETKKNLSQLPNFAYSTALAHFYQSEIDQSTDLSVADKLIQNALILFPGVLSQLIEKCSIQWDSTVARHPFFTSEAEHGQSHALSRLISLYVHRTYHEWKNPKILPWLEKNVHEVLLRVDSGDPYVKECLEKRSTRYPSIPRNVLRHIILSDIKEVTSTIANDITTPILGFDPLPPLDSVDLYPRQDRESTVDAPTITLLFRSLLPDFNINIQPGNALYAEMMEPNGDAEVGAHAPAPAGHIPTAIGDSLRYSVTVLMDAIGMVLANIPARDGDSDDDDDDDDDDDNDDEEVHEHQLRPDAQERQEEIATDTNPLPVQELNHRRNCPSDPDRPNRGEQNNE